jgi:hypothetical protein
MIIAWILFASTGILLARYYKFIFPETKISGVAFWFFIHRFVMSLVPVLSIVAFVLIFAQLKWNWVRAGFKTDFMHSIAGAVTIGLSVLQPLLAIFRCDKDHKYRFVFNYVHRTIGVCCLLMSSKKTSIVTFF